MEKKKTSKPVNKKTKEKAKKQGFFKGLKLELKKVKWPDKKDILKFTIATLFLCLILGGFFELLNMIFAVIKGLFN